MFGRCVLVEGDFTSHMFEMVTKKISDVLGETCCFVSLVLKTLESNGDFLNLLKPMRV